jgi:MinD-like ATPase involved in chromosome partitioning or flagellar assembly/cell division septation protein DedD
MWHDFKSSEVDNSVTLDGRLIVPTEDVSAYGAAMAALAESARQEQSPALVRSTGSGGVTWFTVTEAGVVAAVQAPEDADVGDQAPADAEHTPAAPAPAAEPVRRKSAPTSAPTPQAAPEGAPEPLPTRRRPTAADYASTVAEPTPSPAREEWQGVVNSLTGGAFRVKPGAAELQRRRDRARVQRGLSGHKTVVFVNLKGGATKTTSTYLVGATLGRVRGGNMLAWDNNENQGTLGDLSMAASHDHTARDLLENIERFAIPSNSPELTNYVRPQGENRFHVLSSQNKASNQEAIDGNDFVQLHGMLRQFYHLILVDTGNAATASTWQAAVEIADEIVLVALNKRDSTKKLAATVDILVAQGLGDKLARGVLLLTEAAAPQGKNTEQFRKAEENRVEALEHFGHYVREIVQIPYDGGLSDGLQVVFEDLRPATQQAYLAATAAIVDGL